MSADDVLVRARQALEGITPGKWEAEDRDLDDPYSLTTVYNVFHNGDTADRDLVAEVAYDNARFIAAAPQLVADLIREIDDLRTMLDTDNLVDVVERCQAEADVALARAAESETLGRKLRDSATDHFRARLDAEAERDRLRDIIARVRKVANAWAKPDYTSNETEGFGKKIIRALGDEAQG